MTKYIIFDSGSLINITQNGLIEIFKTLAKDFQGEFLITPAVKYETIEHPLQIKKFEWGALRIQQLLEEGVIKLVDEQNIVSRKELDKKTEELLNKVNNVFFTWNKSIKLIERGETESLALSLMLKEKGIDSAVSIDERTARMICEDLDKLKTLMESKLHTKIKMKYNLPELKKVKILRSTEIMYAAYQKGIMSKERQTLEAILYALKFGGCSISEKEIDLMKKA